MLLLLPLLQPPPPLSPLPLLGAVRGELACVLPLLADPGAEALGACRLLPRLGTRNSCTWLGDDRCGFTPAPIAGRSTRAGVMVVVTLCNCWATIWVCRLSRFVQNCWYRKGRGKHRWTSGISAQARLAWGRVCCVIWQQHAAMRAPNQAGVGAQVIGEQHRAQLPPRCRVGAVPWSQKTNTVD